MTKNEVIDQLESLLGHCKTMRESGEIWARDCEALRIAIATLRDPTREQDLWHDAKTDPPETSGLYYGKKDDTNSMYACRYRDGVWVLDAYPQTEMDIVQWADYSAFAKEDVEHSLRGPTREQVEAFPKCNYCEAEWGTCDPITNRFTMPPRGGIRFCPMCGHPMTDEAVEITLQRLEALHENDR